MNKEYQITKEQCQKLIHGVCEGCGRELASIETIDNAGNPTFWVGCNHCLCFRCGIERIYFEIARELVENNEIIPYHSMDRHEYENDKERLDFYFDSQTAGLSQIIKRIHFLIKKKEEK